MIETFAFGDQGHLAPDPDGSGQRAAKVMTGPILIRADAGPELGTGHVMRCLAVAEALHDLGHTCHFLCAALPPALAQRLVEVVGELIKEGVSVILSESNLQHSSGLLDRVFQIDRGVVLQTD